MRKEKEKEKGFYSGYVFEAQGVGWGKGWEGKGGKHDVKKSRNLRALWFDRFFGGMRVVRMGTGDGVVDFCIF